MFCLYYRTILGNNFDMSRIFEKTVHIQGNNRKPVGNENLLYECAETSKYHGSNGIEIRLPKT